MQSNKKLFKFLVMAILTYGCWLLVYEFVLKKFGQPDHLVTENITYFICAILDKLGYNPHYNIAHKLGETYIFLAESTKPLIRVGASCNGLELIALYVIFIVCYPAKTRNKIAYIFIGVLFIHLLNIARNLLLTLMVIHQSVYFELFHRYIFIFMVYGAIFGMWLHFTQTKNLKHES